MDALALDWTQIGVNLFKMGLAYALALPIAWNREREAHTAGLRTFPLVAVASCAYLLFAVTLFDDQNAQSRLIAGLITGIGFIGGGAILKEKGGVHGTATAASIWNTGAIGGAVAYAHYEIAIVLSLLNFATFRLLGSLKGSLNKSGD